MASSRKHLGAQTTVVQPIPITATAKDLGFDLSKILVQYLCELCLICAICEQKFLKDFD